jgi:toxin secretion/phage lysis holin
MRYKIMDKLQYIIDEYSVLQSLVMTALTAFLGPHWWIFGCYLLLNLFDMITGVAKAKRQGIENSKSGTIGIFKKFSYWILISISFMLPHVLIYMGNEIIGIDLGITVYLGWYTLFSLIFNEVRSISENLVELGVEVPIIFTKGLKVAEMIVKSKEKEKFDTEHSNESQEVSEQKEGIANEND